MHMPVFETDSWNMASVEGVGFCEDVGILLCHDGHNDLRNKPQYEDSIHHCTPGVPTKGCQGYIRDRGLKEAGICGNVGVELGQGDGEESRTMRS